VDVAVRRIQAPLPDPPVDVRVIDSALVSTSQSPCQIRETLENTDKFNHERLHNDPRRHLRPEAAGRFRPKGLVDGAKAEREANESGAACSSKQYACLSICPVRKAHSYIYGALR
jgi:hypothetical protein